MLDMMQKPRLSGGASGLRFRSRFLLAHFRAGHTRRCDILKTEFSHFIISYSRNPCCRSPSQALLHVTPFAKYLTPVTASSVSVQLTGHLQDFIKLSCFQRQEQSELLIRACLPDLARLDCVTHWPAATVQEHGLVASASMQWVVISAGDRRALQLSCRADRLGLGNDWHRP